MLERSIRSRPWANLSRRTTDPAETREWLDALDSVFARGRRARGVPSSALDRRRTNSALLPTCCPRPTATRSRPRSRAPFPAILSSRNGSRRSCAGTRWPWSCAPTWPRASSAATSRVTLPRPRSSRSASIISSARRTATGRRYRLLPAALGAGRLRARLPRRPPHRRHLKHYRREIAGGGLCSYPHPWLMPDFWQTPDRIDGHRADQRDLSGALHALPGDRGLWTRDGRHVWGVFGDGEMDEPESIAGLSLAARERLDNLTFVINCNLQRLDGPVRGNGQIIQELEPLSRGRLEGDQGLVGIGLGRAFRARRTMRCFAGSPRLSTASTRRSAPRTAPTILRTSSRRTRSCARSSRICPPRRSTG